MKGDDFTNEENVTAGKSEAELKDNSSDNKKAMRLMAQLIKFYKFYYLLYLNKGWLNSQ